MSRKQLGVIYRAYKEGKLEGVDQEDINKMYEYCNKMGDYDFARKEGNFIINCLREAVDAIFNGDYHEASNKVRNFKNVELF